MPDFATGGRGRLAEQLRATQVRGQASVLTALWKLSPCVRLVPFAKKPSGAGPHWRAACNTPYSRREAGALPASILPAVRTMLRSIHSVGSLGRAAGADVTEAASFCRMGASNCLVYLLASPWSGAAALRAGADVLLVESCQVRGLSTL